MGTKGFAMESLLNRFLAKINIDSETGCWLWTAATLPGGYGSIGSEGGRKGKTLRAHRVAWELYRGPIPTGRHVLVLHKCDAPRCVNPDHLFLGHDADNAKDMKAKGRSPLGEDRPNHKLTAATVQEIRATPRPPAMKDRPRDYHGRVKKGAGVSNKELARRYGVSTIAVFSARNVKTWKHV